MNDFESRPAGSTDNFSGRKPEWKKFVVWSLQGSILGIVVVIAGMFLTSGADAFAMIRDIPVSCYPLFLALTAGAWLFNGARTWALSRGMGYPLSFMCSAGVALSAEFGIAASPGGVGGAGVRLALLRKAGIPFAVGTGMMALDFLMDILFLAMIVPFAVYAALTDAFWRNMAAECLSGISLAGICVWTAALAVAAIVCLVLKRTGMSLFQSVTRTDYGRKKRVHGRARFLRLQVSLRFREARRAAGGMLRRRRSELAVTFLFAMAQWTCRYSILPLLVVMLRDSNDYAVLPLFVFQGFLFMLALLVVVPGGGGSVEALSFFLLPRLVPGNIVGIVTLVWRFFTYHLYLIAGGTVFAFCVRRNE